MPGTSCRLTTDLLLFAQAELASTLAAENAALTDDFNREVRGPHQQHVSS